MELTYVTAGESHGPGLTVVVSGVPAGVELDHELIRRDLRAPPGWLRPQPAPEARAGRRAAARRHPPRPRAGQPHRVLHREPRSQELDAPDERVAGDPRGARGVRLAGQADPASQARARRPPGRPQVRARGRAQRARARQRPRDGRTGRRRRRGQGDLPGDRHRGAVARPAGRHGAGDAPGLALDRRLRARGAIRGALPRPDGRGAR